ERRIGPNCSPDIGQRHEAQVGVACHARTAAHGLSVVCELDLLEGRLTAVESEDAKRAVRMTAVVQARDRLLARVAALREADRPLVEARLRRKDALVELAPEPRRPGEYPQPLQLALRERLSRGPRRRSRAFAAGTPRPRDLSRERSPAAARRSLSRCRTRRLV